MCETDEHLLHSSALLLCLWTSVCMAVNPAGCEMCLLGACCVVGSPQPHHFDSDKQSVRKYVQCGQRLLGVS